MSNLVFQEEVKEVSDLFYLFSESRKRSPERSKSYFCPKCEVKEVLDLFSPHFGVTAEVRGKRGVFPPPGDPGSFGVARYALGKLEELWASLRSFGEVRDSYEHRDGR